MNELSIQDVRGRGLSTPFLVTVVLAAAAIMWAAPKAAQGDFRDLMVAFVILQSLWILLFWRIGVYMFMSYVVVEGFLINYFKGFTELNLIKDVFVALLFVSVAVILIMQRRAPVPRLGWVIPFGLFAIVYASEMFNPSLPNVMVGLVGCRVTLYYSLLAAVAYWFFDSVERMVKFFAFMVLSSIPVAAFGIVQYFKGPAWMLSISPGFERALFYAYWQANSGDGPVSFRTFSTFVQTGGFSSYLVLLMLVTAAFFALYRMAWQRVVLSSILLLQFFALLTTGGRASLLIFVVCAGAWWLVQRRSLSMLPALLLLPLLFYASTKILGMGFLDRFSSTLDPEAMRERNLPVLGGIIDAMKSDWTGLGAGYAVVASRHVGETELNGGTLDNGLARIRFEAGLPGLVLYIIFLCSFGVSCVRHAANVADSRVRWFAIPIAGYIVLNLLLVPLGTPFDVSPTNVYLWFFAGFLGRAGTLVVGNPGLRARMGTV